MQVERDRVIRIRRAIVSVTDKTGIVEFARALEATGAEVISTGGTARALEEAGVKVTSVSAVTGHPEILGGRVKTLHPKVHGGILAIRDNPAHIADLEANGIGEIDMVVCNLYRFEDAVKGQAEIAEAVEEIDIGGPTLIRAAAKNFEYVVVVTDPRQYGEVLAEIRAQGGVSRATRLRLAKTAFDRTAEYDSMIATYFAGKLAEGGEPRDQKAAGAASWVGARAEAGCEGGVAAGGGSRSADAGERLPERFVLMADKVVDLRYGENPHQAAAVYRFGDWQGPSVVGAKQLSGKELSYNNINDADAALRLVLEFTEPCAVAVKHTNPCGVGLAPTIREAYVKAYEADPVSIFGGIVALSRVVDEETARELARIFLEVVIAPGYTEGALGILASKKNLRLLEIPEIGNHRAGASTNLRPQGRRTALEVRSVSGGLLVQSRDEIAESVAQDGTLNEEGGMHVVTAKGPAPELLRDLEFAWKVVAYVKSNAIVVAKDGMTLGVGAGQMNRIDAARYALSRAGEKARGAVLASDAFFPFRDVVDAAAEAGIAAIIQPGGSIRDRESIDAADEHGISMVFTGRRHFRH